MKIIKLPNKKLRQISEDLIFPLNNNDIKLIKFMINYIDDSQNEGFQGEAGVGIAAVQLGFLKRMFYVNIPLENNGIFKDFFINPKIIAESQEYAALATGEGCLSINPKTKNTSGLVHRKNTIKIKGYSYFFKKEVEYTKSGYEAIVLQHEMDHLNGKLFIDLIDQDEKWKEKKQEVIIY